MIRFFCVVFLVLIKFCYHSQSELLISHNSGTYQNEFVLKIEGDFKKAYFTLDGSLPNSVAKRWRDSLVVKKTSNVRIKVVFNDRQKDTIINRFFLFDFKKELPLLHLSVNPDDLWDDEVGIYVKGANAYYDSSGSLINSNWYKNWEKKVHFIYIENDSVVIQQNCGIKLFGESTRRYQDKSFKLIARSEYGDNKFNHPFFPLKKIDKHKHLVIRSSGNDYNGTRFKDVLSAYLVRNLEVDHMAFQPIHLFINAEYWGLYNLREKINEHYLKYNKGINKDSLSIVKGKWIPQHGSSKDYMKMYKWFLNLKQMDSADYVKANEFLDMRNYINFRIFQLYINNSDSRGNIRYWNSKEIDGKFRMILYDTDHGYRYARRKFLQHSLSNEGEFWYNPPWSTRYLRKLMNNDSFKNEFLVQYAHLLNTALNKDSIIQAVDYLQSVYINELPRPGEKIKTHLRRIPKTEEKWLIEVEKLRTFARMRHDFVKTELVRILAPNGWFDLVINNDKGKVSINGNYPICLPFKGQYLKGIAFNIEALDDGCHQFVNWSDGDTNRIKLVNADSTFLIHPVYECVIPEAIVHEQHNENVVKKHEYLGLFELDWLLYIGYSMLFLGIIVLIYFLIKTKKAR